VQVKIKQPPAHYNTISGFWQSHNTYFTLSCSQCCDCLYPHHQLTTSN